ncbi:helix-turn-helix domain-containing protein [Roseivirga sp.]|uniref:helix-turn-helix domain-containing protein n=1 Tax=Roseivirga sp. TaxID=1964215 RepID=UPI003B8C8E08
MELEYNFLPILILLGGIQGLIFSLILLLKRKSKGQVFLGVFMLVLSYNAFETFTAISGLGENIVFFDLFSFTIIFLLGPSLYFYIHSILLPEKRISKKVLLPHLALPVFQCFINIFLFATYLLITSQAIRVDWDLLLLYAIFDTYSQPLSTLVFAIYVVLAIRLYINASAIEKELIQSNSAQKTTLQFIKILLIIMSVFSALWILTLGFINFTDLNVEAVYYPIEIILVFFTYWSFFAINNKMQFLNDQQKRTAQLIISKPEATLIIQQLKASMEEQKLYLNSKITRELVARETQISPKHISTVLNQFHNQNFNDFINSYRIKEVKRQLHSGKLKTNTITGLALDAGFNSQATFQRVFKKSTGISPKEYASKNEKKVNK